MRLGWGLVFGSGSGSGSQHGKSEYYRYSNEQVTLPGRSCSRVMLCVQLHSGPVSPTDSQGEGH